MTTLGTSSIEDSSVVNLERFGKGAQVATSKLQQHATEVRNNVVYWQSYLQGQMISNEVYNFISSFDKANPEARAQQLQQNPQQFVFVFRTLIEKIAKEQTLQYILTLLDDALQEDKSRGELFKDYAKKKKESVWQPFFHLLDRDDKFMVYQAARIIAKIACFSKELMERKALQSYLIWLKDQLRVPSNEYLQTAARCLQMMLRIDHYRVVFVDVDGISSIISVLSGSPGFQVQYQLVFCIWCVTFNPVLVERINKHQVIPAISDVLSESVKEKVTRICLATLRNMLEKVTNKQVSQEYALSMVRCKVLKQVELIEGRKPDDEELKDDLEYLEAHLKESVANLSSMDEYVNELRSGHLEWSPVHKSDRFWHENAANFNNNNYELLKILVKLLETSKDALILSVAAHDLGEYARYYPRGKNVIEQLGAKELVMRYMMHEDPNVKYEALIAVQKMMVHNWEYLGTAKDAKQPGFALSLMS